WPVRHQGRGEHRPHSPLLLTKQQALNTPHFRTARRKDEPDITLRQLPADIVPRPGAIALDLEQTQQHAQMGFRDAVFFQGLPETGREWHDGTSEKDTKSIRGTN